MEKGKKMLGCEDVYVVDVLGDIYLNTQTLLYLRIPIEAVVYDVFKYFTGCVSRVTSTARMQFREFAGNEANDSFCMHFMHPTA
ncbi:hypothetical protein KQX54_019370 [Cotesia glomerata]|uniref:Uncharacterized protein n=1 Tax=Cotesia glomerata TaxID=32391 RepID=A0AAV7HZ03_COTGL|nr:hypothetical protein KQX54_019370 [Cotesia glomerata]